MFERAADIGRIIVVEVRGAIGPVGIAAVGITIEQSERHQRIEEIARAAWVKSQALCKCLPFKPFFAELGEKPELDGAQQGFGFPEREADVEDAIEGFGRRVHASLQLRRQHWRLILKSVFR